MQPPGCAALWVLLLAQVSEQVSSSGTSRVADGGKCIPQVAGLSSPSFSLRCSLTSSGRHLRVPWDPQLQSLGVQETSSLRHPPGRTGWKGWKPKVSSRGGELSDPGR